MAKPAKRPPANRRRTTKHGSEPHPQEPERVAAAAGSGDLADQLLGLVMEAADPWAVAQRLIPDLQKIGRTKATFP